MNVHECMMMMYYNVHVFTYNDVLYTKWSVACNHSANIWELPTMIYNVICVLPDYMYLLEHSVLEPTLSPANH